MKSTAFKRKIPVNVLTNGKSALLSVQKLKIAVFTLHPVHNVKRKAFHNRFNYGISLFFLIHKLSLKRRADIQFTTIPDNAVFLTVFVSVYDFPYFYLV